MGINQKPISYISIIMSAVGYHEYEVIGRHLPTDKVVSPKIYRMRIFARSAPAAKGKFWYFMKRICSEKVKKASGEVLSCTEIFEQKPLKVKNYAVHVKYNFGAATETSNLYLEYRALSRNSAISQMYQELASRYRAPASRIQVISIDEIPASKCRRVHTGRFHNSKISFPLPHRIRRSIHKKRSTFVAKRPNTHF